MSVDLDTVRRVAHLARLAVGEEEAERLRADMNAILGFVEQLGEVDVGDVEPMTSVGEFAMRRRDDVVTDGSDRQAILANAPEMEDGFFVVPKVVE